MGPIKNLLLNTLLVVVSLGVGAVLVEGFLHVLPSSLTGIRAELPLQADPDVAFRHKGNVSVQIESQCFSVPVSTNSVGFRDTEWDEPQKIAVLGDSFTEGAQVADGQDFSSRLESYIGVPVMNLGEASFGTVAELAAYKKFVRPQKPDVTLLMLYPGNDITDNDCSFSRGPNGTVTKPCGEVVEGEVVFNANYYSTSGNHAFRSFIRESCFLCRLIREFPERMRGEETETVTQENNALSDVGIVVTEEALRQLRDAVLEDGGQFVVALVPDYLTAKRGEMQPEETLIRGMLQKLNIDFIPLTETFLAYKETHALPDPYFSYRCDGHWNPVGHEVAALTVAEFLIKNKFISAAGKTVSKTPQEILGEDGYRSVYESGVYRR